MRILILFTLLVQSAYAQLSLMQSSSSLDWKQIENDHFEVVFPDTLEKDGQYIMNLLEHYRGDVAADYQVIPKKFTMILRPEMASPNGFVTLGPRRSEWFANAAFSPFVGSLDWYQSLAIHEFRHVVQFDQFDRSWMGLTKTLFGDTIHGFFIFFTTPTWFFEGDAVWAETKYSDAGRGRSPRFSAKLKSILLHGEIPSYDQLIIGDYNKSLVNHYVYGYYLSAAAYKQYGPQVMQKIIQYTTTRPLNPYAFYNGFKRITGKKFDLFYTETMVELQKKWRAESKKEYTPSFLPYRTQSYPFTYGNSKYHLERRLDSLLELKKDGKTIAELPANSSLSRIHIEQGKLVYTQFESHYRYALKNYSELFLFDLKSFKTTKISNNKRYYNPQINKHKKSILVTDFTDKGHWDIVELDFSGKELQRFHNTKLRFTEAIYSSGNKILAIALEENGEKKIISISKDKSIKTLLPASRNNIYSLSTSKDEVYFEADYQGRVNIFSVGLKTKKVKQCTFEEIAAYTPSIYKDMLSYATFDSHGNVIKESKAACKEINKSLTKEYLGHTVSDFYHEIEPVKIPEEIFSNLRNHSTESETFSETEGSLTPHSWDFLLSRGVALSVTTQNKLNTFSAAAVVGTDDNEGGGYAGMALSYTKYYPVFSFSIGHAERKSTLTDNSELRWGETTGAFNMLLPYSFTAGNYSGTHLLTLGTALDQVTGRDADFTFSPRELIINSASFDTSLLKKSSIQQIYPARGYNIGLNYFSAEDKKDNNELTYLGMLDVKFYFPGLKKNHGIKWQSNIEYRPGDSTAYSLSSIVPRTRADRYSFSRGHEYIKSPSYARTSLDYTLPAKYIDAGFKDWVHFNRVITSVFVDHTKVIGFENKRSLNSYGGSIYFESLTFRKMPFVYGLQIYNFNNKTLNNIFIGTIFDI